MTSDLRSCLAALARLYAAGSEPGAQAAASLLATAEPGPSPSPTAPPFPAMLSPALDRCHPYMADIRPALPMLPWYAPGESDGRIPPDIFAGLRTCTLFGPGELIESPTIRGGLFAQDHAVPYGARAHLAEELFIVLAGRADWMCNGTWRRDVGPGGRVYHPSDAPHASATPHGFVLAAWVWWGDIAYDSYHYTGQG